MKKKLTVFAAVLCVAFLAIGGMACAEAGNTKGMVIGNDSVGYLTGNAMWRDIGHLTGDAGNDDIMSYALMPDGSLYLTMFGMGNELGLTDRELTMDIMLISTAKSMTYARNDETEVSLIAQAELHNGIMMCALEQHSVDAPADMTRMTTNFVMVDHDCNTYLITASGYSGDVDEAIEQLDMICNLALTFTTEKPGQP